MNQRRKIEERLRKKEQEIQDLETQVREGRAYIQALNDVLKMMPREASNGDSSASVVRAGSMVAQAREAILKQGKPLHVTELLTEMGREISRDSRASLAGSLAAYVRRGEVFTRPAPNVFGLVEMSDVTEVTSEPPADFGRDVDDDPPF